MANRRRIQALIARERPEARSFEEARVVGVSAQNRLGGEIGDAQEN
jgi:hypothetical protein